VRRRAFVALRDLLSSLTERSRWSSSSMRAVGDVDSVALLVELMRPPRAPPLLLVMTYRKKR